ncbi:MAG: alpha/beta fold hydrolase [Deltaproteobacteria bacterium]|nr:alpha/beta fold hydrolase [Deltaproteobacteria bacterium]
MARTSEQCVPADGAMRARAGFETRPSTVYPGFVPRFPWLGGDLQTLRYYFFPCSEDLSAWPSRRLSFPLPDGSGDVLVARLHRPHHATDRPLVILVHGLTGCEGSSYMFETTRSFLARGYPVMRLNLRGAGPSRETCRGSYCGGSGDNVAAVLSALDIEEARHGVVLIGFSLGGTVTLHCLARHACAVQPICAVTVSTPLDLAAVIHRLMRPRNVLYHRWLLGRMKDAVIAGASEITPGQKAAVLDARSIREFDDAFTAPHHGFADADDYYARCSATGLLDRIDIPLLLLHARNDPWIPADPYVDIGRDTPPNVTLVLTGDGGHVGFHARHGATPWYNTVIQAYLETLTHPME